MSPPKNAERRGDTRHRARIPVRYWNETVDSTSFTADISKSGMFVEGRAALAPGTRLHVELTLNNGPFFVETAVARVVQPPRAAAPVVKGGLGLRVVALHEAVRQLARESTASSSPELQAVDLRDPTRLRAVYDGEIKRGGLFVPGESAELAHGQRITVVLLLPEPVGELQAHGTVVHRIPGPSGGVGLQLEGLDRIRGRITTLLR